MTSRKEYLARNTIVFAINTVGTRLITFFLVPIYTNVFTTAEYGVVDLITTLITVLAPIITLNIGEAVMRFALDDDADQNGIISIGILLAVLSLGIGFLTVFVVNLFPQITVNSGLIYWYCVTQGLFLIFSCNLRGQEKLVAYAIGNILHIGLAAALNIIFLLPLNLGINGYFWAYILSNCATVAYCIVAGRVSTILKKFHIDLKLMGSMIKYAIVLVPNSLMWWIMNSSDRIMVTAMIGTSANGIYAVSYKVPSILHSLSTIFNQAWSYSAIHEDKSADRETFSNNMFDRLVRFQLIITIFLLLIIRPFLRIYVQPSYYDAWVYTPYLLVGYFFLTLGSFLSTSYTVQKDSRGFLFSGMIGAIANIVLNLLLIPRWGVHGAAFATCISYFIVFIYRIFDTRKYIIIRVFKPEYIVGYILLIVAAVTMALPSFWSYIVMAVVFAVVLVMNIKFIKECWNLGKNFIARRRKKQDA